MKNAHQRFGTLEFTKRVKDTTTRIGVYMDRLIVEPGKEDRRSESAHLVSVIGSDAEIAALWAALTGSEFFQIQIPGSAPSAASLGPEAQCFRGSVMLPGRRRPIRHLVAVSGEMLKTKPGTDRAGNRTILCDNNPRFVLYRVARRFGLPVVPEWAPWFMQELERRKAIQPLLGLGCTPVLVKGDKSMFLDWIGRALKAGSIGIPEGNGAIAWKASANFLDRSPLPKEQLGTLPCESGAAEARERGLCE